MGISTKGIYADYIKRVKSQDINLSQAFDVATRHLIRSEKIEAVIAYAAAKLGNELDHYAKHHVLPPKSRREWQKMIDDFSQAYLKTLKVIDRDLAAEPEAEIIYKNYLFNVVTQSELINSPYAEFFLSLVDVCAQDSKLRYDNYCRNAAKKLMTEFDRKTMIRLHQLHGDEVFSDIVLLCLRGVAYPQNVIVGFLNQNYPSNAPTEMSVSDIELKRVLENQVFNKVKLEKHESACLIRELSTTVMNTLQVIKMIVQAYDQIPEDSLSKSERPQLSILMYPYQQLAMMTNPFVTYDDQKSLLKGLVTVQTTSGDKYVGIQRDSQLTSANEHVDYLVSKLSECFKSQEANRFADLLSLCSASYESLRQFSLLLASRYRNTRKFHELSALISLCDGASGSVAIKTVQNGPKLVLLLSQLYGKESDEARWMRKYIEQSNEMTYLQYVERVSPEVNAYRPQITRLQASLFKSYRDGSRRQLNACLKSAVNSNDLAFYDELNKIVTACRDYYALNMASSDKAKMIVVNLDALSDSLKQESGMPFETLMKQVTAMRDVALKQTRQSGLFATVHRDTYTQTLVQLCKMIEKKLLEKQENAEELSPALM